MSRNEAVERSRRWLEEQLEILGGLSNGSSRDPAFKLWRQNTLTVLQRIWPGEQQRSETFRRIAFTPPGARSEPAQVREMYGQGCAEAVAYLRDLIAEIEAHGISESAAPAERDESLPHGEDDFPTVELPGADERAQRGPDSGDNDIVLDLGGPSTESPLAPEPRAEDSGLPPTLSIDVSRLRASSAPAAKRDAPAGKPSVPAAKSSEPAAERTRGGRGPRGARRGAKQRLKDMLGFSHLSAPADEAHDTPAPAEATPPAAEAAPVAGSPDVPAAAPVPEGGVFTTKPSKKSRNKPVVSIESLISPEFRSAPGSAAPAAAAPAGAGSVTSESPAPATAPPQAEDHAAAPADPDDSGQIDHEAFERAAEDFLKNSPVLGLVGRPVQRQKDDSGLLDPDAVALASLAADVARHGVPEGRRAAARTLLLDLARELESGTVSWEGLRGAVNFAMEFPELARRLLPVLLPWLERAA